MPSILITEDQVLARTYQTHGGCVLGVVQTKDPAQAIFEDADAVVMSYEGVTERFLRLTMYHHAGLPYVVAQTRRLCIRESVADDYEAISAMLCACPPHVFSESFLNTMETDPSWFYHYTRVAYAFFGYGIWSVVRKTDQRVVGWCGLFPNREEGEHGYSLELGYVIAKDQRGKGYAQEACSAICAYAGEELGCDRLCLHISPGNVKSQGLARKLGFHPAGQSPQKAAKFILFPAADNRCRRSLP